MDPLHATLRRLNDDARHARYLFRFHRAQRVLKDWKSRPHAPLGDKSCLIDIRHTGFDGEQGRRFHALVMLLRKSGYGVYLVPRLPFLQTGTKAFKERAIHATRPYDSDTAPKHFDLCLTDANRCRFAAQRTLRLTRDVSRALAPDETPLPYSFFPDIWDLGEGDRLAEYQCHPRRWQLFFAGHCQAKSYQKIAKFKELETVNRYELLQECLSHFEQRTTHLKDADQLRRCLATDQKGFVVADSSESRIATSDWLGILSHADFFLAAPGCDYPLAHNCIESLAVGTIPVLEYGELFSPALRDGVNCLTYRGKRGLRETLARVEQMSAIEIAALRQGAIDYWSNHLSPQAFRQQLESDRTRRVHVFSYLMRRETNSTSIAETPRRLSA